MVEEKKSEEKQEQQNKQFEPLEKLLTKDTVHIVDDREDVFHNRVIQVEDESTGQRIQYTNVDPNLPGLEKKEEQESDHLPFVPHKHK